MDIKQYMADAEEKPLDNIVTDGGFCAIFRRIACVGDSLSSGEFEITENGNKQYIDCFEYSWGQFLARMCGSEVYNFSRGGMTASEFCNSFGEANGCFDTQKKVDAYIIALGVNDIYNRGDEIGTVEDINPDGSSDHPSTFAAYYGELILRYKRISPNAKFFLMMPPDDMEIKDNRRDKPMKIMNLLKDLVLYFDNSYLIDLWDYAPKYDTEFKKNFYLNGHLNPQGYLLTAKIVASYIDWIIRNNPADFEMSGLGRR